MSNKERLNHFLQIAESSQTDIPPLPASREQKVSPFYENVAGLVRYTRSHLEPSRPWWNGDLWEERVLQLKILDIYLLEAVQGPLYDDTALYVICYFMKELSSTKLFSTYNSFKERMGDILRNALLPNQMHLTTRENLNHFQACLKRISDGQMDLLYSEAVTKLTARTDTSLLRQVAADPEKKEVVFELAREMGKRIEANVKDRVSKDLTRINTFYLRTLEELRQGTKVLEKSLAATIDKLELYTLFVTKVSEKYPEVFSDVFEEISKQGVDSRKGEFRINKAALLSKFSGIAASPPPLESLEDLKDSAFTQSI